MVKLLYKLFSYYVITSLTGGFCCINKLSDTELRLQCLSLLLFLLMCLMRIRAHLREYRCVSDKDKSLRPELLPDERKLDGIITACLRL